MYGAGTVVAGKYRIERMLGEGGMGTVMAATHLHLGTPIALKFLHPNMAQNAQVVDRFMREARSSARLRGENVCRVSDVGNEQGVPYIVMELLTGQDLGAVLRTSGALPPPNAAEIILQSCVALGEAHQLGIVHRDIKPGNLFWTVRPDGTACIKVLDFGVAKAPDEVDFSLTQTSSVIGSPGYMSPEQLKSSKTADARSDIWSLGVVLYELVSGRKPFHGESITELALRVTMDPLPPLGGLVPPPFEQVIMRCLEKDPARRFADVAELAAALAPYAGPRGPELAYATARVLRGAHTPISPLPIGANTPTTLRGANGVMAGGGGAASWRLPVIMGAGAAVGVAIALVVLMGGNKDKDTSAATAPAAESQKLEATPAAATPAPVAATPAPAPVAAAPVGAPPVAAAPAPANAEPAKQVVKAEPVKETKKAEPFKETKKAEPAKETKKSTETAKTETKKSTETAKTETKKSTETAKTEAKKSTETAKTEAKKSSTETKKTETKKSSTETAKKTTKTEPAKTEKKPTSTDIGDSRE